MSRLIFLLLPLAVLGGCPSPAAPPGPPAEIPSALTIPRDLSIDVDELPGSADTGALKLQTLDASDIGLAIEIAVGTIEETNFFLDFALGPVSRTTIPVGASVFTFENTIVLDEEDGFEAPLTLGFKFDFGRFDLDGDGALEACSGCTCPVGCAPDLAVCPTEAPEAELRPICFRVWLAGERFMAGVFDRVPTEENAQSGRFRMALPSFGDQAGSPFGIIYDHSDPNDRLTDLSAFFQDPDVPSEEGEFFANRRSIGRVEGPEATSKKTSQLTSAFLEPVAPPGLLQFQSEHFTHLDFISLEVLADGLFGNEDEGGVLGVPDISPPICAQITTANPVNDILCTDLGLTLTPGEFVDLPVFEDVLLPPFSEFPELPAF